jgi:hypothetical protein
VRVERPTVDDDRWKRFVDKFPSVNIFHSPEMAHVFGISQGYEAFPLFATFDSEVVAAAFPVLVGIKSMLPASFKRRLIMYASPLYLNDPRGVKGVELILRSAEAIARKTALFMEIRNSEQFPGFGKIERLNSYDYIPYQNYLLDLEEGADKIWSSFSTHTRNHIRKAERKGVVVRTMMTNELPQVSALIAGLYHRKGVPLSNPSICESAYRFLTERHLARFIVADVHTEIIGALISLNYNGTVFHWYAASKTETNQYYPNEALIWDTIRWGCNQGYRLYDLGGGGIRGEEYGPAKFKDKFKGSLVEYGRYRCVSHRIVYNIGRKLYELRLARAAKG